MVKKSPIASSKGSSSLPDLDDNVVRRRLGPSALMLFRRILVAWKIPTEEARQLLCIDCGMNLDGIYPDLLSADQMLRISYIIGIYDALHRVYGDPLADEWIQLPNANRIFGGAPPLTLMTRGGTEALQTVRRYIESRAQGH